MHRAGGGHSDNGLIGRLTTNRASQPLQSLFTRRGPGQAERWGGTKRETKRAHTHGGALFGVALPWCHVVRLSPLRLNASSNVAIHVTERQHGSA